MRKQMAFNTENFKTVLLSGPCTFSLNYSLDLFYKLTQYFNRMRSENNTIVSALFPPINSASIRPSEQHFLPSRLSVESNCDIKGIDSALIETLWKYISTTNSFRLEPIAKTGTLTVVLLRLGTCLKTCRRLCKIGTIQEEYDCTECD